MKNLYDVETGVKKDVVLFRYEDPKKIIGRAWIGLACIPFGMYMSQTSLMLTPTMESWQDRELDAKTSYLMDNVKYTSRGTFRPLNWFPRLSHFFLRSWGLLAYFSAS